MRIIIRCDANANIGIGHFMRDLVLAESFHDAEVFFACHGLSQALKEDLKQKEYTLLDLHTNTFAEFDTVVKKHKAQLVIIDHYDIDISYEKQLKAANKKIKLMVVTDLYTEHYCDILLNPNIYAQEKNYKGLVPATCELRCGEKHLLLRKEFTKAKKFHILLAMGGSDPKGYTLKIVKLLLEHTNTKLSVITTRANPHLKALQKLLQNCSNAKLHIETKKLAKLARKSDFAIITPSVLANELYSIGVPFIAIQSAPNQKEMSKFLKKKGYTVFKELDIEVLERAICERMR